MRKNFIKVFPKDKCLEIAKIVHRDHELETWSEQELLNWLPDEIFGNEMRYNNLNVNFEVFDGQNVWYVPTYFVDIAPVLII